MQLTDFNQFLLCQGVDIRHVEFGTQRQHGPPSLPQSISNFGRNPHPYFLKPYWDQYGHGTRVASLLLGEHIGVAPQASLISVKLLKEPIALKPRHDSSTVAEVVAALTWVLNDAKTRQDARRRSFDPHGNPLSPLRFMINASFGILSRDELSFVMKWRRASTVATLPRIRRRYAQYNQFFTEMEMGWVRVMETFPALPLHD